MSKLRWGNKLRIEIRMLNEMEPVGREEKLLVDSAKGISTSSKTLRLNSAGLNGCPWRRESSNDSRKRDHRGFK